MQHHGSKDSATEEKTARRWSCRGSQMMVGVKAWESQLGTQVCEAMGMNMESSVR
jgi:hypothetical protein